MGCNELGLGFAACLLAAALFGCQRTDGPASSAGDSSASKGETGRTLGSPPPGGDTTPSSTSTAGASGVRPDEWGPPEPVRLDVIKSICERGPCSGEFSRIEVWRSDQGKIGLYVHHGDIRACSHPPSVWFDPEGKELMTIALRPVAAGSEEARQLEASRERLQRGLKKVDSESCPK